MEILQPQLSSVSSFALLFCFPPKAKTKRLPELKIQIQKVRREENIYCSWYSVLSCLHSDTSAVRISVLIRISLTRISCRWLRLLSLFFSFISFLNFSYNFLFSFLEMTYICIRLVWMKWFRASTTCRRLSTGVCACPTSLTPVTCARRLSVSSSTVLAGNASCCTSS